MDESKTEVCESLKSSVKNPGSFSDCFCVQTLDETSTEYLAKDEYGEMSESLLEKDGWKFVPSVQ